MTTFTVNFDMEPRNLHEMKFENEYQCHDHKLDLICRGCMKAWIERHDAMKDYLKWQWQDCNNEVAKKLLEDLGLL